MIYGDVGFHYVLHLSPHEVTKEFGNFKNFAANGAWKRWQVLKTAKI